MKSAFIRDLKPDQTITEYFLVQAKEVRSKRSGEPYLSLMLADRSGQVDAKMWDNVAEVMDTIDRDDFVKLKGVVQVHHNRLQVVIHKLRRAGDREVEARDFFPCSERNLDEMVAELHGVIALVQNPHLSALLRLVFEDTDLMARFRIAPAAKSVHHAFIGGLIEHVLSLCGLCRMVAANYRDIDLDLLLTGALLHDIGKTRELDFNRSIGYTNEGQLLGHIAIGLNLVEDKLRALPTFPRDLRTLIEHMILSHHGSLEFGSPKVPSFPEALLLHHLDNLDSKMECMRAAVARDACIEGCWTAYNPALERVVLKKAVFQGSNEVLRVAALATPETDVPTNAPAADPVPPLSPSVAQDSKPPAILSKAAPPTNHSPFASKLQQALHED
jgi:3'-5' exoribonuclease